MEYGLMPGRYPAIVKSYDQERRTCRIEIPGLTDGADVLPEAEIEYPIGDKSRAGFWETEIEINPDDTVWVAFVGGDPRYPVITGARNPRTGNSADWRRWHHKNIELIADQELRLVCGTDGASSTVIMTPDHIWIDAARIDYNLPHPRPFLAAITYPWMGAVKEIAAWGSGKIFRKIGSDDLTKKGET